MTTYWIWLIVVLASAIVGVCVVLGVHALGCRRGWWW